jgi:hypothetical protein
LCSDDPCVVSPSKRVSLSPEKVVEELTELIIVDIVVRKSGGASSSFEVLFAKDRTAMFGGTNAVFHGVLLQSPSF